MSTEETDDIHILIQDRRVTTNPTGYDKVKYVECARNDVIQLPQILELVEPGFNLLKLLIFSGIKVISKNYN